MFQPLTDERPDDDAWPELVWPVPADTVLEGEVVTLRQRVAADHEELSAALRDERVWRHQGVAPATPDDWPVTLTGPEPAWATWTVRLTRPLAGLPAGAVVGTTSYLDASSRDARVEIGATAYAPAVWGTAVNPETKLLLLTLAFEHLHAGRVQLKTDIRNHRSQQAIARLGARFEGVLRRYQRRPDGSVRDTVMFSITAEEWPEVREGLRARLASH